ncbi:MAG TPA: hypothetical protein VM186_06660 [Planctomycetota bacterium]|nr:hypothetical protein [Planctomycetota bacterium]
MGRSSGSDHQPRHTKGSIAEGKDADLANIDADFNIDAVFVGGRLLWRSAT